MQPYVPLGTLYAAALMRDKGYSVNLHDTMFSTSAAEIEMPLQKHHPKYLVIYDDGFNYLTKMCLTNMRDAAFEMIAIAKKSGCKIIVSSSDSTDHYENYLQKGADVILLGEAELSLEETINAFEKNIPLKNIQGIAFSEGEKVMLNSKREIIKNPDVLPIPAYDLADINYYKHQWEKHHGYFSLNISTTRGCPFKCNWCAKPIYGNRYNVHSTSRTVDLIEMLMTKYDVNHFWMTDDIFGLKPGWINSFADEVKKRKLKFNYKIQSRVDLLLQENNIKALAESGCSEVWVGAESGSQKILDAMDKGTTVEQIYEATSLLKKHGVKPCFFLQFGYPGEKKEDIDLSLKMLFELMPHDIGISVSYPLPGTKFFEQVKNQLQQKSNWTDSDELALMFHNTYPPSYYKTLQRFVHRKFRALQGVHAAKKIIIGKNTVHSFKKMLTIPYHFSLAVFLKMSLRKLAVHE